MTTPDYKDFTDEQKNKYLRITFGSTCPDCGSEDIEGECGVEVDGGSVNQEITCNKCGCEWYDIYTLTDVQRK